MTETRTLQFESGRALQSLYANDLKLLKTLEDSLGVKVTTREGWVKLEGDPGRVDKAQHRVGGPPAADARRVLVGGDRLVPAVGVPAGGRRQCGLVLGFHFALHALVERRVAEAWAHVREVDARDVHGTAALRAFGLAHRRHQRLEVRVVVRGLALGEQAVEAAAEDGDQRERPLAQPPLEVER